MVCGSYSGGLGKSVLPVVPLAVWCLLIFTLSSVPGNKYPDVSWEPADKLVHVGLYFWVGVFSWIFFRSRSAGAWSAAAFGILYGLSDEIHQLWVPRRSFSWFDWLADSIGVMLGILVIFALHHRWSYCLKVQIRNQSDSVESVDAS